MFSLVLHHILADDWSLDVLGDELAQAYVARRAGRPPAWPPLPLQYADYARSTADQDRATTGRRWRTGVTSSPGPKCWTCRPTAPAAAANHRRRLRGLPPRHLGGPGGRGRLSRLGRTTPFMTLLAGYLAVLGLLHRDNRTSVSAPR